MVNNFDRAVNVQMELKINSWVVTMIHCDNVQMELDLIKFQQAVGGESNAKKIIKFLNSNIIVMAGSVWRLQVILCFYMIYGI